MGHIHEDLRRTLAETDEEYRNLLEEHARCETRLQELQGKAVLDDGERLESVNIKKQKLHLKDRMEAILRGRIERATGAGVRT
ncbi:MAG: DUF465 domain-containing protein [Candidatus Polarisedimenticolia bacterium]